MLSCGANVEMLSYGANVIIWCYLVMLSSGMITPPFFIFPENFTHSFGGKKRKSVLQGQESVLLAKVTYRRQSKKLCVR
jgi:hypothetical protein